MKEYPINLINCLVVIWKRKTLVIVGVLVCMVAGGVVSLRLPKIYRAEALISIGMKVKVNPSVAIPAATYSQIDSPKNLTKSIPAMYELNEESLKYHIKVEEARGSMIRVSLEGPDRRRAKELLKEIVNKLIDEHLRVAERAAEKAAEISLQPLKTQSENLEKDIKMFQDNKSFTEKKMEKWEAEKVDPMVIVSLMGTIWDREKQIRTKKQKLLENISALESLEKNIPASESLEKYKTRVMGGIRAGKAPVKPKMKRNVIATGIAGLWMSIFLAFIIEYLGKIKEKRRRD